MKNKECIFILGMHRSGTSALTSVFHKLGFNLGEDFLQPDSHNPLGYYENKVVVDINDNLLYKFGYEWDNPNALIDSEKDLSANLTQIENFLEEKFSESSVVVIKDPRFCLTILVWIDACKKLDITPKFILLLRNPWAVAKSLHTRNLFSQEKSYQLFTNYLLQAEKYTRNYHRVIIDFHLLLHSTPKVIEKIFKKLSISINNEIDISKVNNFLKPALVHYFPTIDDIEYDTVKIIYQSLLKSQNKNKLDEIKKTYENNKNLFLKKIEEKVSITSQLFYDLGVGFKEESSIVQNIDITTKQIVFELEEEEAHLLERLRFDPSNTPVLVKINNFYIVNGEGEKEVLDILEFNGIFLPSTKQYIFISYDPIFILSKPSIVPYQVYINLEFSPINQAAINELGRLFNDFEVIKKQDLKSLQKIVEQKIQVISNIERERDAQILKLKTEADARIEALDSEKAALLEHKAQEIKELALMFEQSNKKIQRKDFQITELNESVNNFSLLLKQKKVYISASKSEILSRQKLLEEQTNTIHNFKKLLAINQTVFDENEKQIERLNLELKKLNSLLEAKERSIEKQVLQYDEIAKIKKELELKNHELINLLQMEQHSKERAEQKLIEVKKEKEILQKDVEQNHQGVVNLFTQIQTINNNLIHQKKSIDELKQLINQKDELLAHQNEELLRQKSQLEKLDQSFGSKLWNVITFPFRLIYNLLTNIKLFFAFFFISLKKPIKVFRHINLTNINTLFKALKNESPSEILYNFKRLLNNSRPVKISVDQLGIEAKDIEDIQQKEVSAISIPANSVIASPLDEHSPVNEEVIPIDIVEKEVPFDEHSPVNEEVTPIDIVEKEVPSVEHSPIIEEAAPIDNETPPTENIPGIKEETSVDNTALSVENTLEKAAPGEILLCLDYARYESKSLIKIVGWGIGLQGVEKIEIHSNGQMIGEARLGVERLDVHYAYPDYENSKRAGFLYEEKTDKILESVEVRVIGKNNKYNGATIGVTAYTPPRIINQVKKNPYDVWVKNNTLVGRQREHLIVKQKQFAYRPLISIVIPVYNVEEKWLKKAIDSIKNQIYDNWEICLADDASPKKHVVPYLQKEEESDVRIKVFYRKENGRISAATNSGLQIATGEYVAFMDNDDELAENAFYEIVAALNKDKSIDILYSDEDKMTEDGQRYDAFFKPDWSPELLLSYNYFNHLLVVRKSIVDEVKGLRTEFDGAQDYDFILRVVEKSKNIHHIPKVLYHWRAVEGSIAAAGDAKSESFNFFDKVTGVLQDYLDRNNLKGKAFHPPFARKRGLGLNYIQWSNIGPLVSIVIPSKNHYEILKTCLDSLEQTSYKNYEVIIADNGSDDKKTLKYLDALKANHKIKVITIPNKGDKFSYAYINNEAIKHTKGKYILLLNDDTEIISPKWLSQMVGYAELDGVGIVGAKLIYPDNSIQHAGVLTDLYTGNYDKMPDHVFKNHSFEDLGYYFFANVTRNYSCVTAACMLISKDLYHEVGGLDEDNFALAYNDVDLCLKVIEKEKRVVYAADAVLYHYESKSRKDTLNIEEVAIFKDKWRHFEDVYYNPNLSKVKPFTIEPLSTLDYKLEQEKVLIVSHNLNFEGAPIQMLEIVEGLLKKADAPIFEVYSPVHGPLREAYEKLGLTVHIFGDPVTKAILKEQAYEEGIAAFRNWMKENEYTAVYANTLVSFFVHEACYDLNIKSVWGIHESAPPEEFFTYLGAELKEKAFESFNYPYSMVFVAKATERIFESYDMNHSSVVINNGLRTERFKYIDNKKEKQRAIKKQLGVAEDEVLFLNLGTVCKRKGQQDFVVAAIDNIKSGLTKAKYVIVGARPSDYTSRMLQTIADHQMEDYFIIVEETGDVEMYYLAADVFVCSSYNESYPRVILEAMLFQLPIITTPIFGIAEQVIENVNALFYPPGNIYLLNKQMKELSLNHEKRALFQKNSPYVYQLINSYEEMVDKYEEML